MIVRLETFAMNACKARGPKVKEAHEYWKNVDRKKGNDKTKGVKKL